MMKRISYVFGTVILFAGTALPALERNEGKAAQVIADASLLREVIATYHEYCFETFESVVPTALRSPPLWEIFSIVDGSCSRERTESLRKSVETFRDACGPCFFGSNPMIPLGRAQQQLAEVSQRFERIELLISGDYQIPDSERRALREKKATEDHVEEEEPTATNNQRQRDENEAVAAFGAVAWAIKEEISKNWSEPGDFSGLSVAFLVKVDREGNVLSVKMTRSSGDARLDESAENAIFKASPLPFPDEGRFYEYLKEFNFIFKPES